MSEQKRNTRTKKEVPPVAPVPPDDSDFFEDDVEEFTAENLPFRPSYLTKFNQFLEKEDMEDSLPTYYLYKFDNYYSGKKNSLVDRFEDQSPPDEHDIGMKHGSGRYMLFCTVPNCRQFPNGTTRAYRFRVNPIYDDRRNIASKENNQHNQQFFQGPYPFHAPQPAGAGNNLADTIGLMKEVVSMITPLLSQKKDESSSMREIVTESYSVVGEIMRTSMMEQMKIMQQMTKQQLKLPDLTKETEPEPPGIIEKFLPVISEWLPKLMGSGPSAAMAGSLVKSIPQFRDIIDDSQQLNSIVQWMCEAHGIESTAQILTNLGIPFEMPQSAGNQLPPEQQQLPPEIQRDEKQQHARQVKTA
jgi:hypothetical protein